MSTFQHITIKKLLVVFFLTFFANEHLFADEYLCDNKKRINISSHFNNYIIIDFKYKAYLDFSRDYGDIAEAIFSNRNYKYHFVRTRDPEEYVVVSNTYGEEYRCNNLTVEEKFFKLNPDVKR